MKHASGRKSVRRIGAELLLVLQSTTAVLLERISATERGRRLGSLWVAAWMALVT